MSNILKYFISNILKHFETGVLYLGEKGFLNDTFSIQLFNSLYVIDATWKIQILIVGILLVVTRIYKSTHAL